MSLNQSSHLEGVSSGYHGQAVFKLTNGQVWQQRHYMYRYHYAYRPGVRLFQDRGVQMLQIAGMDDAVEVVQVSIACEGTIVSEFRGFNSDVRFEFQNSQVWEPAEYKYSYHYAHRPNAMIVNGVNGLELHVEGMNESLRVRRCY